MRTIILKNILNCYKNKLPTFSKSTFSIYSATSNSVINETPEPSQHEFFSSKSKTSLLEVTNSMQVVTNFINEDEEQLMMNEIEKVLKRIRYEQSHWDDAIHNYRETEHLRWRAENKLIIDRVREKAFSSNAKHIKYVHILDIAKDGHIKPHVDSVRVCFCFFNDILFQL